MQTDISLSQFLAIQEKGVSAWEFEPELEIANCFVEARTEIEFFDSECSVQTNLPVPKQNDVYYWEAKIYDKPASTLIAVGMSTKPYPMFRLPGMLPSSPNIENRKHSNGRRQAIIRRQSLISPTGKGDSISPSPLRTMGLSLPKGMSLEWDIGRDLEPFSSPGTGRNWTTWCTG